ncbi:VOC family protein [Paenibacillus filicis]|uniref:VOC family protein n=1 Tax=Paenibacillus gyeongsangnamensis TaxID=3388067 RepID=A0ABT4QFN6_9BACL|nr:VOC family protein [Paenibacillus filicis]MCZ8515694.1 VOC family protein [Paenibacillus filicis]
MSDERQSRQDQPFPAWQGFHHIALVTPDLDETIRFYAGVLGMQAGTVIPPAGQRGRHCFIKPGSSDTWGIHFFEQPNAHIFQSTEELKHLAGNPGSTDLYRFLPGALQHIAFALPSESEGLMLRAKLQDLGVVMTDIYNQGTIRNFIFPDNNGIQLEAAWPCT